MAKTKEQLKTLSKQRRTKYSAENKTLKQRRNWYPITDEKKRFTRKSKVPRTPRLRKSITPGQVLILLSGRFRGRRVIFLKQLQSGLLLVTGPYKLNGVPLKRVNQAYVLTTQTKVELPSIALDKINDEFFGKKVKVERKSFFEDAADKKNRITEERSNAQNLVDTEVLKAVAKTQYLKEYLQNRFALKNGQKVHELTI